VNSAEQLQAIQQQQMMQQMAMQGINPAITQAGQLMKQNMANQAQAQPTEGSNG